MRANAARADRFRAVRVAARGWRRAGAIDEGTLSAIDAAYPDDRVRLGLGLRILAGVAAGLGGGAVAVLFALVLEPRRPTGDLLYAGALAALLTVATEIQVGPLRRAQAGAEYATAILAALAAGLAWGSLYDHMPEAQFFFGFAVAFALAAWRWGYAILAAFAAALLLCACGQGGFGRATWLVCGLAALPMILVAGRSPRWPPAHRASFKLSGLILLAGAYCAANPLSLERRWIDWLRSGAAEDPGTWARRATIVGTILIPPAVLALGVRFRDRELLAAGAIFTAASLATLRHYHPIGPWWLALVLGGTACLALAVAVRRVLDAGAGRERLGFTADPLFDDRRALAAAQAAATLVAMSPGPRATPGGGFEGGAGRSGGGGATGGA